MKQIDTEAIKNFLDRGVEKIYPSRDFVESRLMEEKSLKIYLGIDPTGPTLHMGHAIPLKKLKELQQMGHKIILLIGDFTALSGDPDKTEVRKKLTKADVKENAKKYKKQASTFLSFKGHNKARLVYNSKWLNKLNFGDVINIASYFTVEYMLKRDMFKRRIDKGTPLYIHEFMYPLMQAYDSVEMDVDCEIGGTDQTFNMLAGRTLMKKMKNKEKFVITTKLLEDKEGKKMGKTTGNMITFDDSPENMFGKVMGWTDGMIIPGFELCTDVTQKEIEEIKLSLNKGDNPRDIKAHLAKEIVSIFYTNKKAEKAEKAFVETFRNKGVPDKIPSILVSTDSFLSDVMLTAEIVSSKSDFARLVSGGAISNIKTKEKIKNRDYKISETTTFKIGKTRFLKVEIK